MSEPMKSMEEEDLSKAVEAFQTAFQEAGRAMCELELAAEKLREEATFFVGEAPHHSISTNLLNNLIRWHDAYYAWESSSGADEAEETRLREAAEDAAEEMYNETWELYRKPRSD